MLNVDTYMCMFTDVRGESTTFSYLLDQLLSHPHSPLPPLTHTHTYTYTHTHVVLWLGSLSSAELWTYHVEVSSVWKQCSAGGAGGGPVHWNHPSWTSKVSFSPSGTILRLLQGECGLENCRGKFLPLSSLGLVNKIQGGLKQTPCELKTFPPSVGKSYYHHYHHGSIPGLLAWNPSIPTTFGQL